MVISKAGKYLILLLLIITLGDSCSKYEEGPYFSLITTKKRLSRNWKVEYSINLSTGISHSADFDGWNLSFDKSGSYIKTVTYNIVQVNYSGNWDILGKNVLKLTYNSNSTNVTEFYTIVRLTRKELWLKNDLEEIHYYSE